MTEYSGSPLMRSQSSSFSDANRVCQFQNGVASSAASNSSLHRVYQVQTVSGD
ncbi:Uncharacterised protein [Enterobacter roggenkampii]|nr:Uncharacterised protein [Enterobacter roggenkampii]